VPLENYISKLCTSSYYLVVWNRRSSRAGRENRRTPLPPLHKGHIVPCECRVDAMHRYHSWPGLNLCSGMWRGEGIFLTQSGNWNRTQDLGGATEALYHYSKDPFTLLWFLSSGVSLPCKLFCIPGCRIPLQNIQEGHHLSAHCWMEWHTHIVSSIMSGKYFKDSKDGLWILWSVRLPRPKMNMHQWFSPNILFPTLHA
jgi:hypothetical protein